MAGRPRTYKAEGIILRRRNIGEADSVFTVFSARDGKFEAVARGVRKPRSHMRGHLEPLTCTRMMLARGRTLDVFTQAETVTAFRTLREDLERGAAAIYCAELVDRFAIEHAEHPGLYELLFALLAALDAGGPSSLVAYFEVHLLSIAGYDLRLDACALCDLRLAPEETLLSAASGGLVCRECRGQSGGGRIIDVPAIKVLRYARSCEVGAFAALAMAPDLVRQLRHALADVIRYVLDREPASARYVDEVERLPGPSVALPAARVE